MALLASVGYLHKLVSSAVKITQLASMWDPEAGLVLTLCPHHFVHLALTSDLSISLEFLLPSSLSFLCCPLLKNPYCSLSMVSGVYMGQMVFHKMYGAVTERGLPPAFDSGGVLSLSPRSSGGWRGIQRAGHLHLAMSTGRHLACGAGGWRA